MNLYSRICALACVSAVLSADLPTEELSSSWVEYPSDPIFAPFDSASMPDDYFPCVLFDKKQFDGNGDKVYYKMWHQAPNGIGLSYSSDGVEWFFQSVVIVDKSAFHPSVVYDKGGFGNTGYHYKMWYWTGNEATIPPSLAIKVSKSADGINWTAPQEATQDPSFFLGNTKDKNSDFYRFLGFGSVIYNPSATSKPNQPMTFPYVAFFDVAPGRRTPSTNAVSIGLAYSSDGLYWKRHGQNPVLEGSGKENEWDGKYVFRASVGKFLPDGKYHMFYSGSDENPNQGLIYGHGIGYATSKNGIEWKKNKKPLFSNADGVYWRKDHILAPTVVSIPQQAGGNVLQMWFSGGKSSHREVPTDMQIGYATLSP